MAKRTRVGYDTFAQWEKDLAEGKIKTLVGKYGFTKEDLADMRQELLLHIHRKRNVKKSWEQITATDRTILDRVLENKIRDLIETHQSLKRRLLRQAESLSKPLRPDDEDGVITYETLLREEQSPSHWGIPPAEKQELRLAMSLAARELNPRQKQILAALESRQSISAAARALRMHRTALQRELQRMREIFYRRKLDEYI